MMSKFPFPWLALGAGLLIAMLLLVSMQAPAGESPIPLLTQMLLAEFGFVLNAVGVWVGLKKLQDGQPAGTANLLMIGGCLLMAAVLGLLGISLWPEGGLTPPPQ